MRVIAVKTLRKFWERPSHADSEQPLKAWYAEAKQARWVTPHEIKQQYRNASIVGKNRVVFNLGGNKYRLVVAINYNFGIVYIRFIGTHRAYDRISAEEI